MLALLKTRGGGKAMAQVPYAISAHGVYRCVKYFNQDLYCDVYNGDYLWEHYFLSDPILAARIKRMGFISLAQLHSYADKAANRR